MGILDIQIVSTSLVEIQSALAIEKSSLSWIQTSYLIAEILAISITGLATRAFGIRVLFLFAISGFSVASLGCGLSGGFLSLLFFRILQGFTGGMLIPLVFSSVFLFFEKQHQATPTMIAGVLAVLAPTLGPLIGGYITSVYGWKWLFFINLPFGILSFVAAALLLQIQRLETSLLRSFDYIAFWLLAICLTSLEIGLKEAPLQGWASPLCLSLFVTTLISGAYSFLRIYRSKFPLFQLQHLSHPTFIIGSALSFCIGIALYGAVYLMPLFLGFVRNYNALEIGKITLVTGIAQLIAAPLAVALERKISAYSLSAFGFFILIIGAFLSASQTIMSDYQDMFWPQIIRGIGFMICLIAPTRIALDQLDINIVPDGSALFNLLRNLGGAIGLALIDTIIFGRGPIISEELMAKLKSGDQTVAMDIGIPIDPFRMGLSHGITADMEIALKAAIEKAALTSSINEAWTLLGGAAVIATLLSVSIYFISKSDNKRNIQHFV